MTQSIREKAEHAFRTFLNAIIRGAGWTIGRDLIRMFEGKR